MRRYSIGGWWQRRRDAPGFKHPITGFAPHTRWPYGWIVIWLGRWSFEFRFCRYLDGAPQNPAIYDSVP